MTNLPKHARERVALLVSPCTGASKLRGRLLALICAALTCVGTVTAHAQSESAQGESAQGESARGESARGESARGEFTRGESAEGKSSVAVKVSELRSVTIRPEYRVPAEVVSLNRSVLSSEVEGVLDRVNVQLGQLVSAGDVIAQVRSEDYELELARIEAAISSVKVRIQQAKLRLAQANNLSRSKFVSSDELLARETDLLVLRADLRRQEVELQAARRNVARCTIRAPFDGVVTERSAQLAGYVRRGDPVVELTDIRSAELEALVPPSRLDGLRRAEGATYVSMGKRWSARPDRISPVIEKQDRMSRARLKLLGDALPAVGSTGELVWKSNERLLPPGLVARRKSRLGVFVVSEGRANFVPLPGAREGRPVAHQLPDTTRLVVVGLERLRDGDLVRIKTP